MHPVHENDVINPYNESIGLSESGHKYFEKGKEILSSGKKLGLVILSGGEGTRLGLSYPEGLFKIHGKNLFEWHLERVRALYEQYGTEIYLFVMASDSTYEKINEYFSKNSFSFVKEVEVFKQNSLEVKSIEKGENMYLNGKVIRAPMGNGDFFEAIKKSKNKDKVDAFNVISVDNVLANVLDEVFVGAFYSHNLDILSKAVKALEGESVGAFFKDGDKLKIREYSESSGDSTVSPMGNICNHLFSSSFVSYMGTKEMSLHEARKKIPYTNEKGVTVSPTSPNGIKKEKFIFDSFAYTTKNQIMCVPREFEFSPLKNSIESATDNEKTCSESLVRARLPKAGGKSSN